MIGLIKRTAAKIRKGSNSVVVDATTGTTVTGPLIAGGTVQAKTPLTGLCSNADALTTGYVNVTGLTLSLTPGIWAVRADMIFNEVGAADVGASAFARLLLTGGTASANHARTTYVVLGVASLTYGCGLTWIVTVTATTTATIQVLKSSGTGTSTVSTDSVMTASNG